MIFSVLTFLQLISVLSVSYDDQICIYPYSTYLFFQYSEMDDNPICIQIPWHKKPDQLAAWEEGRTGYPFIDACMRQLKKVSGHISVKRECPFTSVET